MTRHTGPTAETRNAVYGRDGMACTMCGATYLLQQHHRAGRRMGGTRRPEINSPANLVTLCQGCHAWTEQHRAEAERSGYIVRGQADPALVPLVWHGEWTLLTAAAGVTAAPEPSGAATAGNAAAPETGSPGVRGGEALAPGLSPKAGAA